MIFRFDFGSGVAACRLGALLVAAMLAGCAAPNIWARAGTSASQTDLDEQACLAKAEGRGSQATYSDGSVAGQAAAGAAGGAADVITKYRARDACVAEKGYSRLTITNEEMARLRSIQGAEDVAYRQQLLEKYGIVGAGAAVPPAAIGGSATR